MLELDDIQHILLMRVPALTGRYEFLSFRIRRADGHGCRRLRKRYNLPRRSVLRSKRKNAG